MTAPAARTAARTATRTAAGLCVLLALAGLGWCVYGARQVRSDAQELAWLRTHGTHVTLPVQELGLPGSSGAAEAVWVRVGDRPAFVDLTGSAQRVSRPGTEVSAVLDLRGAPAAASGVAADALHRHLAGRSLRRAAPGLALLVLGGLGALLARRAATRVARP